MMRELLQQAGGLWRGPLRQAGVTPRPPLAAIELSPGSDRPDVTTYLVFGSGEREPGLVVQVAERPHAQRRLMNAHAALTELWAIPALRGALPRPLGLFDVADQCALVMTPLAGTGLDVLLRRGSRARLDQVEYDLFRAQVWLQLMQEATASGAMLFEGRVAVIERLALLHHAGVAVSLPLRAFAEHLAGVAGGFRDLPLPLTGRHGNFQPANVLIDNTRLGVIGWSDFAPGVTPLEDVFRFAVGLAQHHPGPARQPLSAMAAFHHAVLSHNRLSALILEYVDRYLRAVHLPPQAAHLFFGLFLMDQVLRERAGGHRPAPNSCLWLPLLVLYAESAEDAIFHRLDGGTTPGTVVPVPRAA